MPRLAESRPFVAVNIAVLTVSDTRSEADDKSGNTLAELIAAAGHRVAARRIVRDDQAGITSQLRAWIADPAIDVVIATGGTGVTGRDVTPEAFHAVYEKEIAGFGEIFRQRVRGRPADRVKKTSRQRMWASADQPIAAVIGGTEHQMVVTEQAESGGDMVSRDRRDVGADDDDGSCRQAGKRPRHSPAEIAAALRDPPTGNAPEPRSRGVAVGRQSQPATPAAIRGD